MRRFFIAAILSTMFPLSLFAQTSFESDAPRASGLVTIDGVPHAYFTEGNGVPCIIAGISSYYPPLFSEAIKEHVQFIYVDFRNTWTADVLEDADAVTMAYLTNEIDQVRRELGLDKVCVLGHSALGLLALEYALDFPEHTSHVIAIGTPPVFNTVYSEAVEAFWTSDASSERRQIERRNEERLPEERVSMMAPRDAFALRYTRAGPRYWYDPGYDAYWIFAGKHFSMDMVNQYFGVILNEYDGTERFARITAPVFLALGRYDYAVPYLLWEEPKKKLPTLTYHLFERSGHFPMFEEPALFNEHLIAWLKGNGGY